MLRAESLFVYVLQFIGHNIIFTVGADIPEVDNDVARALRFKLSANG